jgi:hypothetical protein
MAPRKRALAAALASAFLASCGSSQGPEGRAPGGPLTCPAPIGPIERESCADIAKEYDVLSVERALKSAGSGPDADRRTAAIQAAGMLAALLKEKRVALCEEHNACRVAPRDHEARDKAISDAMSALVKLWDGRKFTDPTSVERFHEDVLALHKAVDPNAATKGSSGGGDATGGSGGAEAAASAVVIEASKLARIEGAGVTFQDAAGGVTVTVKDDASHDALRVPAELAKLASGKRYLFKLTGTYAPAAAPLLAPGDEVKVRLKYRAPEASELYVALRSIEDPESTEAMSEWKIASGEKGTREATLTAPPGSTGVYLGVGLKGAGSIELDDVELVRGGKVIGAAQAESDAEPAVKTSCSPITTRPIAGKRSLRCAGGSGDRLTIGRPASHVFMAVGRAQAGERAALRTLSLEGGRSLDAAVNENAEIVLGLAGPGTATFRAVEITPLAK